MSRRAVLAGLAALATTRAHAAADTALPDRLPHALRFGLGGEAGVRVALVGADGRLLRGPDLLATRDYTATDQGVLPMPAKAADGRWGFLDVQGRWALAPEFDEARNFSDDGMARVRRGGRWGFVDRQLKLAVPVRFDEAAPFYAGLAAVRDKGGWGYIDLRGELAIAPHYERAGSFSKIGLAHVRVGGKFGFVDRQGRMAITPRFEIARDFGDGGSAPVAVNDRYGLIDAKGEWLVKPQYQTLDDFNDDGLAAFSAGERFAVGYVDAKGRVVIEPRGGLSKTMSSGLAVEGLRGDASGRFVDVRGGVAIAGPFEFASRFSHHGAALVRQQGRWGTLQRDGRVVTSPKHVEPLVGGELNILGFEPARGLAPWVLADGSVEWLDVLGQAAFRLEEAREAGGARQRLLRSDGSVLWSGAPASGGRPAARFFEKQAEDVVTQARFATADPVSIARELIAAKPRSFAAYSLIEGGARDVYDLSQLEDDDRAAARHGALLVLAQDHVDEAAWGRYFFLERQRSELFSALHERWRARLTAGFGAPVASRSEDTLGRGDGASTVVWQLPGRRLMLESEHASGDGDFEHQLLLGTV